MKYIIQKLFVILLLVLTGCSQESAALEAEYEFLSPQVVVLKTSRKPEFSTAAAMRSPSSPGSMTAQTLLFSSCSR